MEEISHSKRATVLRDFSGDPEFPIWLIGDSPPEKWVDELDTPLDPRHSARHNIWTAVVDPVQDRLYRQRKLRLDTSRLYIRNALNQPLEKTNEEQRCQSRHTLKEMLSEYKPRIVLTFGVYAFNSRKCLCLSARVYF